MKPLELLAPAKNLECGIAAIKCGADAVYIGASAFGARKAAGASLEDIKALIEYAHLYRAKVYIAINTILNDQEIIEAGKLIDQVYALGADAIIIQDMGLLELELPPIPIFASTQTNNVTPEKVKFLEQVGFSRVILARELSLPEIAGIRQQTSVDLEVFVHGALCVSYSGQCYLSYANGGRSGNRGECAQPCRKRYSLETADGSTLVSNKHLLSLRDLNLSDHLELLVDAGVTSFKIEGRLKDIDYVKNIVSFYRTRLDEIIDKRGLPRTSSGRSRVGYLPRPAKTFNRGYTDYFLFGRSSKVCSANSPKSLGEYLGVVISVSKDSFEIDTDKMLHNGDGLCFFDRNDELLGTLVNKVAGKYISPVALTGIEAGTEVYRNHDHEFEKELTRSRIERKLEINIDVVFTCGKLELRATDEDGFKAMVTSELLGDKAREPEKAIIRFRDQLSKLGETIFVAKNVEISPDFDCFLPVSMINDLRRQLIQELTQARIKGYSGPEVSHQKTEIPYTNNYIDYSGNVLNSYAKRFYERHGAVRIEPALESGIQADGKKLMTTKLCLRNENGLCPKDTPVVSVAEDLFLVDDRGRRYDLKFNCKDCVMEIFD